MLTDLGPLGGGSSRGNGINNAGQVTGYSYAPFVGPGVQVHGAFQCSNGTMGELGTLGGTLKLGSWDGFVRQVGQAFDLLDWVSADRQFDSIVTSGLLLPEGTALDTSRWTSTAASASRPCPNRQAGR